MTEQHFELTNGVPSVPACDALVEAGCDDATFSVKGGLIFAVFDRDAATMLDAVIAAIEAVERAGSGGPPRGP